MGERVLNTDEVAFNLLAERTCDNCNQSCARKSSNNTCEKWVKYISPSVDIINKIRAASIQIQNDLTRSSPDYIAMSAQSSEMLKNQITQTITQVIPNIESKVEINNNTISLTVKMPAVAEYVQVNFEVKNENKSIS